MIEFIEKKSFNLDKIKELLQISHDLNHWTNFGPISIFTEKQLEIILQVPENRRVILCSSGTAALFGLVNMYNYLAGKSLRWVVSSFAFHCSRQGPLANATIVDCDETGMLDLKNVNLEQCDGIVITNPFGIKDNIEEYRLFCEKHQKILICDSASAFDALKTHDVDEAISLHHTKPWGFGEGGCVVISCDNEAIFRSMINFGIKKDDTKHLSTNAKISDISAAFISQRLDNMSAISKDYQNEFKKIVGIGERLGIKCLINREINHCPHSVPLLWDKPINQLDNPYIKLHKYYLPLDNTKKAQSIYNRIVNFPCHPELKVIDDVLLEQCMRSLK
jgi:dTDP-4-amino-4,6-dideoxygalactose transaminase